MAGGTTWLGRGDPTVEAVAVRTHPPTSGSRPVSTATLPPIAREVGQPAGCGPSCVAESRMRTMRSRGHGNGG